ncbi:hypothetical protein [Myxosarcina sp. GI1]|uniref:hypothetical protein n=1 Tax=Myxosarcina sp. GI1 TaxID=1541065 RepID=UPI0005607A54|nr:hypothetical protein [Myxosarcina sp. GI1]
MNSKTSYNVLLLIVFAISLSFAEEANAFTVDFFNSSTAVDSLEDADALIDGNSSTATGTYDTINLSNAGYGQP